MAAIDYLKLHRLEAEVEDGGKLAVWPRENITPEVRDWIKAHREALLRDLTATDDSELFSLPAGVRMAWTVRVGDKRLVMTGTPYTREQAQGAAQARWPGVDVEVLPDAD
ncbi:hypothetical protein [Halomonas campaniensis]|uniref:hypothetical protein n=1 Tax=Halomonas campaniensis TaxID=213554 RepID=UPI00356486CC